MLAAIDNLTKAGMCQLVSPGSSWTWKDTINFLAALGALGAALASLILVILTKRNMDREEENKRPVIGVKKMSAKRSKVGEVITETIEIEFHNAMGVPIKEFACSAFITEPISTKIINEYYPIDKSGEAYLGINFPIFLRIHYSKGDIRSPYASLALSITATDIRNRKNNLINSYYYFVIKPVVIIGLDGDGEIEQDIDFAPILEESEVMKMKLAITKWAIDHPKFKNHFIGE